MPTTNTAAEIAASPMRMPPQLDRDVGNELHVNGKIERRIVWNLISKLLDAGFATVAVFDGDDRVKCKTNMDAMEAIFAVDDAMLFVKKRGGGERWIKLVGGNGEEVISDWGYSETDRDKFNTFMVAFKSEDNW